MLKQKQSRLNSDC